MHADTSFQKPVGRNCIHRAHPQNCGAIRCSRIRFANETALTESHVRRDAPARPAAVCGAPRRHSVVLDGEPRCERARAAGCGALAHTAARRDALADVRPAAIVCDPCGIKNAPLLSLCLSLFINPRCATRLAVSELRRWRPRARREARRGGRPSSSYTTVLRRDAGATDRQRARASRRL